MKATEFLHKAASLLEERGKQYDQPQGERSMGKAVTAFNAITSRDLSEAEGWLLLQLLKDVRQWQNPERYHADSAEDCVSYAALKAEALASDEHAKAGMPSGWSIGPDGPVYSAEVAIEPAASIDDDSPRAQILGQNGEMASEVYAAIDRPKDAPSWNDAPSWAKWLGGDCEGWFWYGQEPKLHHKLTDQFDASGEYEPADADDDMGPVFPIFKEARPCQ